MSASLNPQVIRARANICRVCANPCPERDTLNLADGCTACPRSIWHAIDCHQSDTGVPASPPLLLGDALARQIETRILTPAQTYAPGIVASVRKCGGCGHAQQALGSAKPPADPGTVV